MIQLFQFAPALGLPNGSPFCLKLETYLRMAAVPFEVSPPRLSDVGNAPKGKMPYIRDAGQTVADSSFIIEHLKATRGDPLDSWLSAEQRAVALAFQRLMEENLYWAVVHTRWVAPRGWATVKPAFFGRMPAPLKWVAPSLVRRSLVKGMHGHGMGRHSAEEIIAIGQRDITALANYLGDKPFFMGEQPCSLDATAYGFLANLVAVPVESALKDHALSYPQLPAFCERIRSRYYA
jgi:glutathione S-transferase